MLKNKKLKFFFFYLEYITYAIAQNIIGLIAALKSQSLDHRAHVAALNAGFNFATIFCHF